MRFTYTYRSSDGQRHAGEIEAESRDAAFGKIRAEMGVKPIRVVAAGGGGAARVPLPRGGRQAEAARWAAGVLIAAAIAGGAWWWAARRAPRPEGQGRPADGGEAPAANDDRPITVATPQGAVTVTVAAPLLRQMIPGDRQRVGEAAASLAHPVERLLARFAEPGRAVAASEGERPTEAEFEACLREPIRIASTDFTEAVDLKRIVAGMKREMRAYIAGGGTVEQYLAELAKRQRLEISYRENAERKLAAMLETASVQQQGGLREAYGYWLKANAQLKSMGIYELPLPDALQAYQAGLGLDE